MKKIQARYDSKVEEFRLLELDQLKQFYQGNSMSSTDRSALFDVVSLKLQEERNKNAKALVKEELDGE